MHDLLDAFFMAWGFFLILPCPRPVYRESVRSLMLLFYPVIGAILGILWAGFALLLSRFSVPSALSAALLAVFPWCMTGFLHLDGFMDVSDAMLSRRPLEDRLRILKDPHCGAFAVISMVVLALLQTAAASVRIDPAVFLLLPIASRASVALLVQSLPALSTSQYRGLSRPVRIPIVIMLLVTVFIRFSVAGPALLCTIAAVLLSTLLAFRNFGGMSGDIAGFALVLGELAGLMAAALGGAA